MHLDSVLHEIRQHDCSSNLKPVRCPRFQRTPLSSLVENSLEIWFAFYDRRTWDSMSSLHKRIPCLWQRKWNICMSDGAHDIPKDDVKILVHRFAEALTTGWEICNGGFTAKIRIVTRDSKCVVGLHNRRPCSWEQAARSLALRLRIPI